MAYKNFKATEIIEEIGAELRKIRTDNNQTISHVAIKLAEKGFQISNTLLGRIENGERRIDDHEVKIPFIQQPSCSADRTDTADRITERNRQQGQKRTVEILRR